MPPSASPPEGVTPGGPGGDRIELRGLRVVATHGLLLEERERPQPFEADLDVHLDLRRAGRDDDLSASVDYGTLAEEVAALLAAPPAALLEHLAERVAACVLAHPGVHAVRVSVRKVRPPVGVDLAGVGVTIVRWRRPGPGAADPATP